MVFRALHQLFIISIGSFFLLYVAACDGGSGSNNSTNVTGQQDAADPDETANKNEASDGNKDQGSSGNNNNGVIISESRALQFMGTGSCVAAECHESAQLLLENALTLPHLQDRTMPPPDQSRYTLREDRREMLIEFFLDRAKKQ